MRRSSPGRAYERCPVITGNTIAGWPCSARRHAIPDHTARTQGFRVRQGERRCQPRRLLQVFGSLRPPCLPKAGNLSIQALSNRSPELAGFPFINSAAILRRRFRLRSRPVFLVGSLSARISEGRQRSSAGSEGHVLRAVVGSFLWLPPRRTCVRQAAVDGARLSIAFGRRGYIQ